MSLFVASVAFVCGFLGCLIGVAFGAWLMWPIEGDQP